MVWVKFNVSGYMWVEAQDDGDFTELHQRLGKLGPGRFSSSASTCNEPPADLVCDCGGAENVRMYDAGEGWAVDWITECDKCAVEEAK